MLVEANLYAIYHAGLSVPDDVVHKSNLNEASTSPLCRDIWG